MASITIEELKAIRPQFGTLSRTARPEVSAGQCIHREYLFEEATKFPVYKLKNLSHDEIVSIFKSINGKSAITEKDLYDFICVSMNVRDPVLKSLVFANPYTPETLCSDWNVAVPTEKSTVSMTREMGASVVHTVVPGTEAMETSTTTDESIEDQASAICFLFAWLTRYVVKSPSTALSIQYGKVRETYMKFYQRSSIVFEKFNADKVWITCLRNAFDAFVRVRNTLVMHVAAAETAQKNNPRVFNLLRYLFFQNLEFMGMHTYVSIVQIMGKVALPPAQILTWLRMSGAEMAIDEAYDIMSRLDNGMIPNGTSAERLWKYARILDAGYFNRLQTSYSAELMATLAYIEIKLGISKEVGHSSPLNITVISENKHIRDIGKAKAEAFMECKARSISLSSEASVVDKVYARNIGMPATETQGAEPSQAGNKRPPDTTAEQEEHAQTKRAKEPSIAVRPPPLFA